MLKNLTNRFSRMKAFEAMTGMALTPRNAEETPMTQETETDPSVTEELKELTEEVKNLRSAVEAQICPDGEQPQSQAPTPDVEDQPAKEHDTPTTREMLLGGRRNPNDMDEDEPEDDGRPAKRKRGKGKPEPQPVQAKYRKPKKVTTAPKADGGEAEETPAASPTDTAGTTDTDSTDAEAKVKADADAAKPLRGEPPARQEVLTDDTGVADGSAEQDPEAKAGNDKPKVMFAPQDVSEMALGEDERMAAFRAMYGVPEGKAALKKRVRPAWKATGTRSSARTAAQDKDVIIHQYDVSPTMWKMLLDT